MVYGMLLSLGYLNRVLIAENNAMVEGYQLNEGLGRVYSLEGIADVQ